MHTIFKAYTTGREGQTEWRRGRGKRENEEKKEGQRRIDGGKMRGRDRKGRKGERERGRGGIF